MKKRTGILINSIIILLGANYDSYLLLGAGVLCLSLVLISKTKRDEPQIKNAVNTYFPHRPNVVYLKRKWMNKICPEDKGGSFNEKLYLDYLDAILNFTK